MFGIFRTPSSPGLIGHLLSRYARRLTTSLQQVTVIVSLLTSPVVHVVYGVIGRGPGNGEVPSMLWSQTFIVLTAVSIAWSIRDLATLRRTAGAAVAIATANLNTIPALLDIGIDSSGRSRPSYGKGGGKLDATHARDSKAAMGLNFSPENSILQAAEALLSEDHNQNSALDGEHRVINVFSVALRQALMHGLTADTPVLQTADALHAWRKVIQYQGGVERDIRETDRWGVLAEKLISMDAGMPFMVGIVQVMKPLLTAFGVIYKLAPRIEDSLVNFSRFHSP